MGKPLTGKRKRGHVLRRERKRDPQLIERSKRTLLIRGLKVGPFGRELLTDLRRIKGPDDSILFSRKNDDMRPFDNEARIEFLCNKNDCGAFAVATHSKKRPSNIVLGRIFDSQLLDMVEVGVTDFVSIAEMLKKTGAAKALGSQTAVIFQGDEFEHNPDMQTLRSILLDLFKTSYHPQVDIAAVDHVVACTASGGKVYIRNYVVAFKGKADKPESKGPGENAASSTVLDGIKIPDLTLRDMGPSLDLTLRRTRHASPSLMKIALKQAKNVNTPKKVKNVTHDELQGKLGRVHMKRQDMTKLVTHSRFKKALPRRGAKVGAVPP
mmetsp:Transcript_18470/g.53045  ORF Transcript_18470/g.53045 Transcript_18470/m.53045 type:complete len:324 (+) Transcript_18470:348-1319(+)